MKKLIVTSAMILGAVILIAGCGQSQSGVHSVPPPAITVPHGPDTMTDDELMDEAARAVMTSVFPLIESGEASSADLAADLQAVEEARQTLRELYEARRAAMAINAMDMASGSGNCSWRVEDFEANESARRSLLARFGLVR